MSDEALTILFPTDVFPPKSGGAGWSTHALALALIERGNRVTAIVPRQGQRGMTRETVLGVPAVRVGYRAPNVSFIKNYFRHERLWGPLSDAIVECTDAASRSIVIHAQHVQVTPAAVLAGARLRAPVVVTVRDHWPWDYFATGLHGDRLPYPRQTWAALATDLPARLGPLRGVAALAAIPYLLGHVRRRQAYLRRADAVIACSDYIAQRLAGIVRPERLHVIPHLVDLAATERTVAVAPVSVTPGERFVLFVGKLERNKGAHLLIEALRELRAHRLPPNVARRTAGFPENDQAGVAASVLGPWSLVLCGDGPLRGELEGGLAELGIRARFLDWAEHDETLRLMARCELLLFPSAWGEPLSRVLLEAAACGAPILAMPTGGTRDVIEDGVSGVLASTPALFAQRLSELLEQPDERRRLGAGARRRAQERFAKSTVAARVEELYRWLLK